MNADARSEPAARGPLRRNPAGEAIAEHVRQLIFEGSLRSGDRIDRERLALEMGTSQIPVREALLRLESEGAIEIVPHRGAFVTTMDEESVREHWELIGLISGLAAAKVAHRGDRALVEELSATLARLRRNDDVQAFDTEANRFMRLIHLNGGTVELRRLLRSLVRQVPGNFFATIPGSVEQARIGCGRILRAIKAGDEEAARAAVLSYMRHQGDLVVDHLRQRGVIAARGSDGSG